MKGHTHELARLVSATAADISLFASGRLAQPIAVLVLDPSFQTRFQGWHLDIRYADSTCTPLMQADVDRYRDDATDLLLGLLT